MRLLIAFASAALLVPTLAYAQTAQTAPTTQTAPAPPPAAAKPMVTFHGPANLGFDYAYEASLEASDDLARQITQAAQDSSAGGTAVQQAALKCVSTPLVAIEATTSFRMLMVVRLDSTCLGVPVEPAMLESLAQKELQQGIAALGPPKLDTMATYQIAGHDARTISGSTYSDKMNSNIFSRVSCVLVGKDAVCWLFLSNDCADVNHMKGFPITFTGKPAEPLVPAAFTQSCSAPPAATAPKP